MSYRVLIIDDNHSFIDSLQVMLKDFAFQYDHTLRFHDGDKKIRENGMYINRSVLTRLSDFETIIQKEANRKKGEEDQPTGEPLTESLSIDEAAFNENGYFLILVEQNTESSLKGFEFIQTLTKQGLGIAESDFILMTDKPDFLEARAKAAGITLQEKPVRAAAIRQAVQAKLKNLQEIQNKVETIMSRMSVVSAPEEVESKERKQKSTSRATKARNIVKAVTRKGKKKGK